MKQILNIDCLIKKHNNYRTIFNELSETLMNNSVLVAGQDSYRICEIEFYLFCPTTHPDPVVHCSPDQKTSCSFYFHKTGTTYRGGTYKGLDITFGSDNIYAGILIRSMYNIKKDLVVEGPCKCVDAILTSTGYDSIQNLVLGEKNKGTTKWKLLPVDREHANQSLYVVQNDNGRENRLEMYVGPRVGLKYVVNKPNSLTYIMRDYRYTTVPTLKKHRIGLITSYVNGLDINLNQKKIMDVFKCKKLLLDEIQGVINAQTAPEVLTKIENHDVDLVSGYDKRVLNKLDIVRLWFLCFKINCPSLVNVKKAQLAKIGHGSFEEWAENTNNVYIGRDMTSRIQGTNESKWKNPFKIDTNETTEIIDNPNNRNNVISKYREYLLSTPQLSYLLSHELAGKVLGCWCKPEECHGDVLIELFKSFS